MWFPDGRSQRLRVSRSRCVSPSPFPFPTVVHSPFSPTRVLRSRRRCRATTRSTTVWIRQDLPRHRKCDKFSFHDDRRCAPSSPSRRPASCAGRLRACLEDPDDVISDHRGTPSTLMPGTPRSATTTTRVRLPPRRRLPRLLRLLRPQRLLRLLPLRSEDDGFQIRSSSFPMCDPKP